MVLLAGPGPEGGGTRCLSPQSPTPPRSVQTGDEDPADYEEYEDFSSLPDTRSIASDDSFYPPGGEEECGVVCAESVPEGVPEAATLLRAACANDVGLLRALVRRGPSSEEVRETDRNGRVSPDWVWVLSALLLRPHFRVTPIYCLSEHPFLPVRQLGPHLQSGQETVQPGFLLHLGPFITPHPEDPRILPRGRILRAGNVLTSGAGWWCVSLSFSASLTVTFRQAPSR